MDIESLVDDDLFFDVDNCYLDTSDEDILTQHVHETKNISNKRQRFMEKENVVWLDVNNLPPRKRRKREIKRPTVEENERNITEWNRLHNLIVKNKLEGDFKKRCLDQKLTCPQPIVFKCEDDMIRKKYVRWNSEQIKLDELYYNKYRLRIAKETLHQASSSDI